MPTVEDAESHNLRSKSTRARRCRTRRCRLVFNSASWGCYLPILGQVARQRAKVTFAYKESTAAVPPLTPSCSVQAHPYGRECPAPALGHGSRHVS